jgi:hypothetical protein
MVLLDFVNGILSLMGEQPLASSSGTLGQMVKNVAQTAINTVAQTVRPQAFEQIVSMSSTNSAYDVPVGSIPDNTIQIYSVFWKQGSNSPFGFRRMDSKPLEVLDTNFGYSLVGNQLYVSNLIARDNASPLAVSLHCLVAPTLPTADDADIGIPTLLIPAIQHTAASILLVSYVDDANAASQHQRLAESMTTMLRLQLGVSRGRSYNIGGYGYDYR